MESNNNKDKKEKDDHMSLNKNTGMNNNKRRLENAEEEDEQANGNNKEFLEHELVEDIFKQCPSFITDLCDSLNRPTVILCNPEMEGVLFDPIQWRKSSIKTLYLFSESDETLQSSIKNIVKRSGGKLFLRLFSRQLLPMFPKKSALHGWSSVLTPDDRSPPINRAMIICFELGKLDEEEQAEFLQKAKHELGDLIIVERLGGGQGHKTIQEWINLFQTHQGIPADGSIVKSTCGQAFGMVIHFQHQGGTSPRVLIKRGFSEGDLSRVVAPTNNM